MAKFEAHITFRRDDAAAVSDAASAVRSEQQSDWRASAFDADPIMGDKPYCYLTAYDADAATLLRRMEYMVNYARGCGLVVLRQKIERIIYDTKTGVDELTG